MRRISIIPLTIFWLFLFTVCQSFSNSYGLIFSTFIGGSDKDEMGDIITGNQGNIYVTGWTWSPDFPTTPGAYDTKFNGGPGGRVDTDGYVMKFDPRGNLIWSTFIGGPNTDLTYSIGVDSQGYVYVAGMGGKDFPTTSNSFQSSWDGFHFSIYGEINAVIVKLEPDGSDLVWSSYFGTAAGIRDLDIDQNGDIYVASGYHPFHEIFPSSWFGNSFQSFPQGGNDAVFAKIQSDGSRVVWATYLGGSGPDSSCGSIAVDANGFVYVATVTESADIPTPNGHDTTHNGAEDAYVAKLTPDGSSMVWGTYLGGAKNDGVLGKHCIALDSNGTVYVAGYTESNDFPATPGAFDTSFNGGTSGAWKRRGDLTVTKLTRDGQLVASTFIGGSYNDGAEGIALNTKNDVNLALYTYSRDFPVSIDAFQKTHAGKSDGVCLKISPDLSKILFSSYMGTDRSDGFRAVTSDVYGNFIAAGVTNAQSWPVSNAYKGSYAGGSLDAILVKFKLSR